MSESDRSVGQLASNMEYYVYILQSIERGYYYIGSSNDVRQRLKQHNAGRVMATKYRRPYKIVFSQAFNTESEAIRVEYKLKKLKRRDFLEKIISDGRINSTKILGP